jgi:hypothetical protein
MLFPRQTIINSFCYIEYDFLIMINIYHFITTIMDWNFKYCVLVKFKVSKLTLNQVFNGVVKICFKF